MILLIYLISIVLVASNLLFIVFKEGMSKQDLTVCFTVAFIPVLNTVYGIYLTVGTIIDLIKLPPGKIGPFK